MHIFGMRIPLHAVGAYPRILELVIQRDEIKKMLSATWLLRNKPEGMEIAIAWLDRVAIN